MKRQQISVPRYTVSDRMVSLVAEITEKDAKLLRRVGPDKGGHWEVLPR